MAVVSIGACAVAADCVAIWRVFAFAFEVYASHGSPKSAARQFDIGRPEINRTSIYTNEGMLCKHLVGLHVIHQWRSFNPLKGRDVNWLHLATQV